MKHIYKTTLVIALVLVGAQTVSAEDGTLRANPNMGSSTIKMETRSRVEAIKADLNALKEKREEMKSGTSTPRLDVLKAKEIKIEARMASSTAKRIELKADVKEKVNKMLTEKIMSVKNTFKNAISNLNNTATRIDSEISKMNERGRDTTASTAALASARVKITTAETSINTALAINASSTEPYGTYDALKSATETARQAVNDARQALTDVIKTLRSDLKIMRPKANATTTVNQ